MFFDVPDRNIIPVEDIIFMKNRNESTRTRILQFNFHRILQDYGVSTKEFASPNNLQILPISTFQDIFPMKDVILNLLKNLLK